jgi:hypothetical protein
MMSKRIKVQFFSVTQSLNRPARPSTTTFWYFFHCQESIKILQHPVLCVALSQVAKNLRRNRPLMVVFVTQVLLHQVVPHLVRPVNSLVGHLENIVQCLEARIAILRAQVI